MLDELTAKLDAELLHDELAFALGELPLEQREAVVGRVVLECDYGRLAGASTKESAPIASEMIVRRRRARTRSRLPCGESNPCAPASPAACARYEMRLAGLRMEAELRRVLAETFDDLRRRRLARQPAGARSGDRKARRHHTAERVAQDGPIKLYATANREGGICYLVDEPWKPANAGDGGTCASRERAAVPISAGGLGASQDVQVIGGRVADGRATAVSFSTPNGRPIVRPLGAGGFYVAQVPWSGCPSSDWNPVFTALGPGGENLAEARITLLKVYRSRGRVMACGGSVTPAGPGWDAPVG